MIKHYKQQIKRYEKKLLLSKNDNESSKINTNINKYTQKLELEFLKAESLKSTLLHLDSLGFNVETFSNNDSNPISIVMENIPEELLELLNAFNFRIYKKHSSFVITSTKEEIEYRYPIKEEYEQVTFGESELSKKRIHGSYYNELFITLLLDWHNKEIDFSLKKYLLLSRNIHESINKIEVFYKNINNLFYKLENSFEHLNVRRTTMDEVNELYTARNNSLNVSIMYLPYIPKPKCFITEFEYPEFKVGFKNINLNDLIKKESSKLRDCSYLNKMLILKNGNHILNPEEFSNAFEHQERSGDIFKGQLYFANAKDIFSKEQLKPIDDYINENKDSILNLINQQ
jgi:hypothetical protein